MKKLTLQDIFNQKKLSTHLYFLILSLIILGIIIVAKGDYLKWQEYLSPVILVFIQLEVFIFLGTKIFKGFNPVATPKEITFLTISRFILFYIACFAIAFIIMIAMLFINHGNNYNSISEVLNDFFNYEFRGWFKTTALGLSAGAIIFIFALWQDALKREQKLREENLIFQNETLKSQVNPHFLFNSLNTISSLIPKQPETAERFINNLSSVYRYILENSQKDKVSLLSELNFITGYYNLHRVRDEEKILLSIDAPDAERYTILPVSLQILLENAIKHNIATREKQLRIEIYIEGHYIVSKNNLQRKATQLISTKTGLKNLAARIKLASQRELSIEETNDFFIVKLPLMT